MKAIATTLALAALAGPAASQAPPQDIGKKACMADAKRLCPDQVKAMNRPGVEHCLFLKIDETTPTCHDTILLIAKQRADKAAPKNGADGGSVEGAAGASKGGANSQQDR